MMSYPREERGEIGEILQLLSSHRHRPLFIRETAPQGVETKGEAKTRGKTKHWYTTHLVLHIMRKQKRKLQSKSQIERKRKKTRDRFCFSNFLGYETLPPESLFSILLRNSNQLLSLGQLYRVDSAHLCLWRVRKALSEPCVKQAEGKKEV